MYDILERKSDSGAGGVPYYNKPGRAAQEAGRGKHGGTVEL